MENTKRQSDDRCLIIKLDTEQIINKKFIDIPYKLGGKSTDGADCMGVVLLWYREQGIVFDYDESIANKMNIFWERRPAEFLSLVYSFSSFIPFQEIKKYDFLLFFGNERGETFPSLTAAMVDDRYLLTSTKEKGSFIEILNVDWKSKFFRALRLDSVSKGNFV